MPSVNKNVYAPRRRYPALLGALGAFIALGAFAHAEPSGGRIIVGAPESSSRLGLMYALGEQVRSFFEAGVTPQSMLFLAAAAFVYGILHALGPGHQKTLVSGYLLADGGSVRHAVAVAGTAAASHAVSVIGLFSVLALVGSGFGTLDIQRATYLVTLISALALVALSLVMLVRRIRILAGNLSGHAAVHDHAAPSCPDHAPSDHPGTASSCTCRACAGAAKQEVVKNPLRMIIAGSLAPCPGAAAFMLLGFRLGEPLAGIIAVLSISLGMWLTLVGIALVSVYARRSSLHAANAKSGLLMSRIADIFGVAGSAAVFLFAVFALLPWSF